MPESVVWEEGPPAIRVGQLDAVGRGKRTLSS